jgi:hypothetical protein
MTTYAVFDKDTTGVPAVVADRFSWLAALLPPVFALVHGLWPELVVYVIVVMLLGAAAPTLGGGVVFWLYVAFALWIGFEAAAFRRSALKHRGYHYRTDIVAASADLAQLGGLKARP